MLDNYSLFEIPLPMGGEPYIVTVHKTYPTTTTPPPQIDLCKISDVDRIQKDMVTGVFRAWIGPRGASGSFPFIVKFVIAGTDDHHKALKREAAVYNDQLASLQGKDIPSMFGIFEGEIFLKVADESIPVTCLFLEDCGHTIRHIFPDLPLADRAQILKKLGHIHLCGVTLDDFAERNVVQKDGAYRLIDFQDVKFGHRCLWKGEKLYEGDFQPFEAQIGCPELYVLGEEFDIWKLRQSVVIYGKVRPRGGFPKQEDIDVLLKDLTCYRFENEHLLHDWVRKYLDVQDRITPEEYMKQRPDFTRPRKSFEV